MRVKTPFGESRIDRSPSVDAVPSRFQSSCCEQAKQLLTCADRNCGVSFFQGFASARSLVLGLSCLDKNGLFIHQLLHRNGSKCALRNWEGQFVQNLI